MNDIPTRDVAYYTCTLSQSKEWCRFLERVGQNKLTHRVKSNDTEPNIPNKKTFSNAAWK